MSDYVAGLIEKHKKKGILVDTNLLLLYFVGSFDRAIISTFKRTNSFTEDDFDALALVMETFEARFTTPNILTEVSNLSGHIRDFHKGGYFQIFAAGVALLQERYLPSVGISVIPEMKQFGLTDVGIAQIASEGYLVLTDDLPLYHYLTTSGLEAINFNHIRTYFWH